MVSNSSWRIKENITFSYRKSLKFWQFNSIHKIYSFEWFREERFRDGSVVSDVMIIFNYIIEWRKTNNWYN